MDETVKPVTVTVATETEPIDVDGSLTEREDGFTLEFSIGQDKFVIDHCATETTVKADGIMSYDIKLCDSITETTLATPFGKAVFSVTAETREVARSAELLRIMLCYVLSNDGIGDMHRSVDVIVRIGDQKQ